MGQSASENAVGSILLLRGTPAAVFLSCKVDGLDAALDRLAYRSALGTRRKTVNPTQYSCENQYG